MNEPPGCARSSFLRDSRADNGTQDRAPGCALRGVYWGSVLGLFLVASNRARSGWSLKRFRWVKISMHNAWKSVSERQGIHLALFFSLVSHLVAYFSHQQCLFCSIYIFRCRMISNIQDWQGGFLPASWHSLTIPNGHDVRVFQNRRFSCNSKAILSILLQGVGPGMLREARIPGPTPWSMSNDAFYSW